MACFSRGISRKSVLKIRRFEGAPWSAILFSSGSPLRRPGVAPGSARAGRPVRAATKYRTISHYLSFSFAGWVPNSQSLPSGPCPGQ